MPPSLLATALVLQTYDGVSDEEAKQRADYDLRWKVALGLEVETRPFAKSTLQEFRAQLILHDKTRAIFQRSLEVAKHRGVWKKGKAPEERQRIKLALDTTYILGRGAVKDTYNLLADGIVQVLRGLAELLKCELLEVAEELDCTRYVSGSSLKGQAEVDWNDPQARQRFLAEIVRDAEQVLAVVRGTRSDLTKDSPEDKALVAAAELLARILDQDIERDEGGPRIQRGVAPDRLISVHDPEMRHGRKSSSHRFNGHKTQVAVDTDSQLITAVEVLAGNAPDAEQALEVVEASEAATECHVAEVLGDCAYGAGETRAEFAAAGRTLIAKVPDLQNQGYFAKTDFQLDLEAGIGLGPDIWLGAVQIATAVRLRELCRRDRLLVPSNSVGIGGQRRHAATDVTRRFRGRKAGRRYWTSSLSPGGVERLTPGRFLDTVVVEHHFGAQPTRGYSNRRSAVRRQLVPLREGQSIHRDFRQVVENRDAVVRGVVVRRPVRHLNQQSAWPIDQQGQHGVRRDQVRVDRQSQNPQAAFQVMRPDRRIPLRRSALESLRPPDVVDQHVDVPVLRADLFGQSAHLRVLQVVHLQRNAHAAQLAHQLGGVLDRLGTVIVGALRTSTAPCADDRGTGFAQSRRDATPCPARCARDDRDAAAQREWIG